MIITNIENVPGQSIVEHFGIVQGSTVRAKHIGRDMMAGLKNLVGGELKGYTELLNEAKTGVSWPDADAGRGNGRQCCGQCSLCYLVRGSGSIGAVRLRHSRST